MQPKLYVTNYPAGDFRAMPALGGGHALLKWVTSFPGNPEHGLPTVTGLVVLSDAETGVLQAVLDAGAVTALRTGAAAVLAAVTLGRGGSIAVVGCGVNGSAAADTFSALGLELLRPRLRPGSGGRRRGADGSGDRGVAGGGAGRGHRRHGHAGARDPLPAGVAPCGPARLADGRGRPREGRDRARRSSAAGASSATTGSRRATAASSPRRWRSARCAATTSPSSAACSPVRPRAGAADDEITLFDSTGLAIQDLAIAHVAWCEGRRPRRAADHCRAWPERRGSARQASSRAGSNSSSSGSRSPRIASPTSSPQRKPSTLP